MAIAVVFLAVTLIQSLKIALVISGIVLLTTLDLIGFVYLTNLFPDTSFVTEVNAISVTYYLIVGCELNYLCWVVGGVYGSRVHIHVQVERKSGGEVEENFREYGIICVHWYWFDEVCGCACVGTG